MIRWAEGWGGWESLAVIGEFHLIVTLGYTGRATWTIRAGDEAASLATGSTPTREDAKQAVVSALFTILDKARRDLEQLS